MMIELMLWLLIKHFVVDFPLQRPYQYLNKGTYGHLGGLLHAFLHGVGTLLVLGFCGVPFALSTLLALLDAVVHYHIDWAKVKITKHEGWTPTTHEEFWWLLGYDQLLHQVTYILIIKLAL